MKIMRLNSALAAIVSVIGSHEDSLGPPEAPALVGNRNTGRYAAFLIHHSQFNGSPWIQVAPLLDRQCSSPASECILKLNPCAGCSALVGDKCEQLSIRRTAHVCFIPISVRNWKRVAAIRWHYPQLVPLAAKVRAVHHA